MRCDTAAHSGRSTDTVTDAHMAEQPISLDGADEVSPGAPTASAEGGDPVGDIVAIVDPRTTLASSRDPETVLYCVKHEQRRSKPLRSNNPLWKFFVVYLKNSLPGKAVCKLCEANGDFADSEVRYGSPTHLRQHLDTKRKGHREVLKKHDEARGAGSKGGGSGGASREKNAGSIIAYIDGVKAFTSKMLRFIDSSNNRWFRTCGRCRRARFARGWERH